MWSHALYGPLGARLNVGLAAAPPPLHKHAYKGKFGVCVVDLQPATADAMVTACLSSPQHSTGLTRQSQWSLAKTFFVEETYRNTSFSRKTTIHNNLELQTWNSLESLFRWECIASKRGRNHLMSKLNLVPEVCGGRLSYYGS
ncbi:hypothetical protein SCLCIDRAFT_422644 [Scleroderma citrinum Foug A]|uniref:Uncharacterized protein n=1 Tax=Scleroderma citrinum Foug A TaxID=1036808 RepID=A0A0C3ALT3_9AGAM|nr:hypothetical protein SCLCIDRAFT_422644 [Scleroderma citrinum Foug A]